MLNICEGFSVYASFTMICGNDIGNLSKLPLKTRLLDKCLTVVAWERIVLTTERNSFLKLFASLNLYSFDLF